MRFARIAISAIVTCIPNCGGNSASPEIRPAQVITIPEDYDVPFTAESGDTVILVMYPDTAEILLARCDQYGGELIYNPFTLIWTCEKVDF